jgi:hypothetical protein
MAGEAPDPVVLASGGRPAGPSHCLADTRSLSAMRNREAAAGPRPVRRFVRARTGVAGSGSASRSTAACYGSVWASGPERGRCAGKFGPALDVFGGRPRLAPSHAAGALPGE